MARPAFGRGRKANKRYKDTIFRDLFKVKRNLQSLYKALTGRKVALKDIKLVHLSNIIAIDGFRNDVGFTAEGRHVVLSEHQSTDCGNMPLRMLWYISDYYSRLVGKSDSVYDPAVIELPQPEFYVFYNGLEEMPDKWKTDLSEAWGGEKSGLELTVTMYNINYKEGRELLEKCYALKAYSVFVEKARELESQGMEKLEALHKAAQYCADQDLLPDYFTKLDREGGLAEMTYVKWDQEKALQKHYAAGLAKGEAKGKTEGKAEGEMQMGKLFTYLLRDGRSGDLQRAASDVDFRHKLYSQYGI